MTFRCYSSDQAIKTKNHHVPCRALYWSVPSPNILTWPDLPAYRFDIVARAMTRRVPSKWKDSKNDVAVCFFLYMLSIGIATDPSGHATETQQIWKMKRSIRQEQFILGSVDSGTSRVVVGRSRRRRKKERAEPCDPNRVVLPVRVPCLT